MIEDLLREDIDLFAWTFDDLEYYKGDIGQHTIPFKKGSMPFRQKLRKINPKLAPPYPKGASKDVEWKNHCTN